MLFFPPLICDHMSKGTWERKCDTGKNLRKKLAFVW